MRNEPCTSMGRTGRIPQPEPTMKKHTLGALLPLLFPLAAPQAGEIALFLGPPGGPGDVLVLDESGGAAGTPAGLSGIQLLTTRSAGASALTSLSPDQPQLRLDVAGGSRLVLPGGLGSLYRFRREEIGSTTFGYFRIDGAGSVLVFLERPGTGPLADEDPFLERLAFCTGPSILVATTAASEGDLLEVDLNTGAVVNRTANLGPLSFLTTGPRLFPTWGTAVAQEGIVRFDRTLGAAAEMVTVDSIAPPTWWDGGVVCSGDTSMAATVAGSATDQAHVLCYGASGTAQPLCTTPTALSGAGFDDSSNAGPYLALSQDGSLVAWRAEPTLLEPKREAWLQRSTPLAGEVPFHLTEDMHFVDTLDETGLIGFLNSTTLFMGVGELADPLLPLSTEIDGMDLYTSTLQSDGTVTTINVSLTSGVSAEPFTKGELASESGVWQLESSFLAMDKKDDTLRVIDAVPGSTVLLSEVKSVESIARAGDHLLIQVRSNVGPEQLLLSLNAVTPSAVTTLIGLPKGTLVERHAARSDGRIGFVVRLGTLEWLARVDLSTGFQELATSTPLVFGPALGFTPNGNLATSVGLPAGPSLFGLWTIAGLPVPLPIPITAGQILPGNS